MGEVPGNLAMHQGGNVSSLWQNQSLKLTRILYEIKSNQLGFCITKYESTSKLEEKNHIFVTKSASATKIPNKTFNPFIFIFLYPFLFNVKFVQYTRYIHKCDIITLNKYNVTIYIYMNYYNVNEMQVNLW